MSRRVVIDPVTRVEGHARVTIELGDDGEVRRARLHVTELRGFEAFCLGRSFREMPALTSRICGICPVSHQLAAARAGDALLAVEVPPAARQLRRLVNLAQLLQSHALSLFHLSAPDLLLGFDAAPARRNLAGLLAEHPEVARDGIRLRRLGQEIIAAAGGQRVHPAFATAGGVARPLAAADRDRLRALLPEGLEVVARAAGWVERALDRHRDEERALGDFPSLFVALVGADGAFDLDGDRLRIVGAAGEVVADGVAPADHASHLAERVEPWTYVKLAYHRAGGYPGGVYRVGPLARLNVATRCGTPRADEQLARFRQRGGGVVRASFHAHHARVVEMLHALERIERLLDDPNLLSPDVQAAARRNRLEGVGAVEAPRGLLLHHYRVDRDGLLTAVDLLVPTGQNHLAIELALAQAARRFLRGPRLDEGLLDRVEAAIRAFDPCLSCASHAAGGVALRVELSDAAGRLLDEARRA